MIYAIIILTVAAGAATVLLFKERSDKAAVATRAAVLEHQIKSLTAENQRLKNELAISEKKMREDDARFEAIANRVLIASSSSLTSTHRESLANLLNPIKREMDSFRQTFISRMADESAERNFLGERLRDLAQLNQTIGRETRRLTDALKGNSKFQGDWGEMILENILQSAGLREGFEYHTQAAATNEEGQRLRPDVVINYSDNRKLVIDSKTSMTDYLRMLEAEDADSKTRFGAAHISSVRKHIQELKRKSYNELGGRQNVDFVLMFIPHEGAFLAAMDLDHNLWQEAYDSGVILISPTHLMTIVRLVEQMWRKERQNQNAIEIADRAADMLKRFSAFIEELQKVERALTTAQKAHDSAYRLLDHPTNGLISKAKSLADLGVKLSRPLP